ncbi:hypothetical protein [Changchengzhania lutea]|uniref:hypothetical protein n=1 Tax=Changchengzhania lutea TaxID=2049305 RepID=UPI00115DFF53|nr:hypothetical protein [Changchengzhania lutea]
MISKLYSIKKVTLIILLISTALNAQIGNTFESATLYLRNNEVLKGEARILKDGTIKFRKKKKEKKIIYTYRKVKKIEIYEDGVNECYKYKFIAGKIPKLMKVIREYPGRINLFVIEYHNNNSGAFNTGQTS